MIASRVPAPADPASEERVAALRRFGRFYTARIGVLGEGYLDTPYSVAQVRVLYEIAHRDGVSAAELARDLALDPAYLSRILRGFTEAGLLERRRSERDARRSFLSLTRDGRAVFDPLDQRSRERTGAMLSGLSEPDQRRLVDAMATIEHVLGPSTRSDRPWLLRAPRPGDLGWVVQRHGALYAQEYGWDQTFEALVADIVAGFGRDHDPAREACWIAEVDGENVGSVFCMRKDDQVARLRLLLVEPAARGRGIGQRLVEECIRFARSAGYRTLTLWTNDVLVSARRIYEAAGFRLVRQEAHRSFGRDLVGQDWEMDLGSARVGRRWSAPAS
jgi:DNA-binding MarR family transcriptional regulator/GNAT superfamily N-acetyltransferase